jgi:cytidine deaminase
MKKITITTQFTAYKVNELPDDIQNIMETGYSCKKNAYAPYSRFLGSHSLDNEKIVLGSNQENAAYPSALNA